MTPDHDRKGPEKRDTMDKLKMHSPNLTEGNIAKLAQLFPSCVTEARDEQGRVKQTIDFDQLRQELSDHIVDGPQERYHLNWPGKREALLAANAPIAKTLRPCRDESVDFDTTKNIFIEGDNLDALKVLQETYLNKIKLICIDPPYNTGNDFIYKDRYSATKQDFLADSGQVDYDGSMLVANTESNGRFHSDWLSMILPRLKISKNLLSDDGIVLIHCDDTEVHNVRKLCDEIFGSSEFVAQFVWKARQFTDTRARTNVSTDHEYIVAYSKREDSSIKGVKRDENKFKNPDSDHRGPWMSRSILGLANESQRPNLHYDIVDPETGRIFSPNPSTGWRYSKEKMEKLISDGCIIFPKKDDGRPREKKFRSEMSSDLISFRSVIDDIFTADGTKDLREIFSEDIFPFPKPVKLVERLVDQVADEEGDLVLDFFAGSGTLAHAVMSLNSKDGMNRRFLLVQLPERIEGSDAKKDGFENICDLSRERIRRAGKNLLQGECHPGWDKDVGFRSFKVDASNFSDVYYRPNMLSKNDLLNFVDNIKPDRTAEDLLFQVLIGWGVDLSHSISRQEVDGKTVFFVDGSEKHMALAACFDLEIDEAFVKLLAEYEPLRVVFRDAGFASDSVKINVEQIFAQKSPNTDVKVI